MPRQPITTARAITATLADLMIGTRMVRDDEYLTHHKPACLVAEVADFSFDVLRAAGLKSGDFSYGKGVGLLVVTHRPNGSARNVV